MGHEFCAEVVEVGPSADGTVPSGDRVVSLALGYSYEEFAGTLCSIAEKELDVAPLITGRVPIDGVPGAFADLAVPEARCKILVTPGR